MAHVSRRALYGTVQVLRLFVCGNCGTPVPDAYVELCGANAKMYFRVRAGAASLLSTRRKDLLGGILHRSS